MWGSVLQFCKAPDHPLGPCWLKPRIFMPYFGGFNNYIVRVDKVADDWYRGFIFSER